MAKKKKGQPTPPTQAPPVGGPVNFPGTISPVSLPVGATGPGLPSGINPLIANSINTPYWQQQMQQNPGSVLSAYSPPALGQLSQFYAGQNLGGSSMPNNPTSTFMPAPQGLRPVSGPGQLPPGGGTALPGLGPTTPYGLPPGQMPRGGPQEPLTPPTNPLTPVGGGPQQGGKGQQGGMQGGVPMQGAKGGSPGGFGAMPQFPNVGQPNVGALGTALPGGNPTGQLGPGLGGTTQPFGTPPVNTRFNLFQTVPMNTTM